MLKRRILFMAAGVALLGVSIALLRTAAFGIDPCTGMNMALSELFGLSLGPFQLGMNALMFIPVVIFSRKLIGLGTLTNMVCVGFIVDFVRWLLGGWQPGFFVRLLVFLFGFVLMCFACALYMGADLGVAPYDAQAIILHNKTKRSFRLMRVATDFLCVVVAVIALVIGGNQISQLVGVGTIVIAFGTGPLIQLFRSGFIHNWIYKKKTA